MKDGEQGNNMNNMSPEKRTLEDARRLKDGGIFYVPCSPKKSFREWTRSEIEEATIPEEDKEIFFKVFTWLEAQKLLRVNNLRDKNGDVKSAEKKN